MKRRIWCDLLVVCGLILTLAAIHAVAEDGGTWSYTGSLNVGRSHPTATMLPDGWVLVVGGGIDSASLSSAEMYDPSTQQWSLVGSMSSARVLHSATLLLDGRVLVAGGHNSGTELRTTEIYNPATDEWTSTGDMTTPREAHTATLLPDGRVLVVGGYDSGAYLASAELYDPSTGLWTLTDSLDDTRERHTATLLPDGRVLVAGGRYSGAADGYRTSAEVYDSVAGLWTPTGSLTNPRANHTATLLLDGRLLVAGGVGPGGSLSSAEVYDASTGDWATTGTLHDARELHRAARLLDGRVLVTGGYFNGYLASTELYDPALGQWTVTGSLNQARLGHTAIVIAGGRVLAAGGYDGSYLSSAEVYTPDNLPPVATPDTYATPEDTLLDVSAPGVLLNDTDPDDDPLSAILDTPPAAGILGLGSDGSFTYMPAADFTGLVTFTYHASDGMANSSTAEVTIVISSTQDPPVAVDDAYEGTENTPLTVPIPGLLLNDTDADGDPLVAALDTPPSSGTLELHADGSFTYMPAPGFVGAVTFTYHASDGEASSNVAVVTVTITPANHAPVAVDDAYTALIDSLLHVPAPGILANDTDADGDPLTAILHTAPSRGALSLSADGSFTYLPALGFTGVVTFTYCAGDGLTNSQPATVALTVEYVSVYIPLVVRDIP